MDGGPEWGAAYVQAQQAQVNQARMDEISQLRIALAEARTLIGHIGWTSCERTELIAAAERWLEKYKHV